MGTGDHPSSSLPTTRSNHTNQSALNSSRRGKQAETLIEIVERKQRPKGRYIVLGDVKDAATSKPLESFNDLVNGVKQVDQHPRE